MAPILTALQLMRLRGAEVFESERTIIERQVQHLVRLVDDLLDVSRITRGRITLRRKPLDVGEVIAKAVEIAQSLGEPYLELRKGLRDPRLLNELLREEGHAEMEFKSKRELREARQRVKELQRETDELVRSMAEDLESLRRAVQQLPEQAAV